MLFRKELFLQSKRLSHMYKNEYKSSSVVADNLIANIIYQENGLLVLNKPYGISFAQKIPKYREGNQLLDVSFPTILPFLKKYLRFSNIYSIRVPEKFVSGVAIFCTEPSVMQKFHTNLLRMRRENLPSDIYNSVVIGNPNKEKSYFKGGIKLETSPNTLIKKPTIVPSCSRRDRTLGIAKSVTISHRTLSTANDHSASLVEIAASRSSWHCVRAYLSSILLSPILGDDVFGSRIQTVLGKPVLVDKFSPTTDLPQKVPHKILKKLDLTAVQDVSIPLHLHLSSVVINSYDKNGTHHEFFAPMPEIFTWTCERLGLGTDSS